MHFWRGLRFQVAQTLNYSDFCSAAIITFYHVSTYFLFHFEQILSAYTAAVDGVRIRTTPSLLSVTYLLVASVALGAPDDRWPSRPPAYGDLMAPLKLGTEMAGTNIPMALRRASDVASPKPKSDPLPNPKAACNAESAKAAGLKVSESKLTSRDSPWRALARLGIAKGDLVQVARAFRTLIRFKKRAPGYRVRTARNNKGALKWIRLRIGVQKAFCASRAKDAKFVIVAQTLPMEKKLETIEGLLLGRWSDALEVAGEARALGILAASLFPSYDTTARRNQSRGTNKVSTDMSTLGAWVPVFRMVVEKRYVEGKLVGYGALEAIELDTGQSVRSLFRFPQRGYRNAFYDARGRPVRPVSLRAPVLDAPLSSGFGFRIHPIFKERRLHTGTDYAALSGSPVFAVQTGIVTHADFLGDYGRLVAIRHGDGLVTRYAHLRQIATGLLPGDKIDSGDLIGYVGTSGRSTGPHLHFETIVEGRFTDPEKYRPSAPPELRGNKRREFFKKASKLRTQLDDKLVS